MYVSLIDGRPFSEIYARQLISKISREELEDKYLRLQEDNQVHFIKLLFEWIFLYRTWTCVFENNQGSMKIFKPRTIKIAN